MSEEKTSRPFHDKTREEYYNVSIFVNKDDPKISEDDLNGKVTCKPFLHQKIATKVLVDIEEDPTYEIDRDSVKIYNNSHASYIKPMKDTLKVKTNVTVMAGKVGSGKTFITGCHVATDTAPKNKSIVRPVSSANMQYKTFGGNKTNANCLMVDDFHTVTYAEKNIVPISFVFCNPVNLKTTWEHEIKTRTKLKYFTITNMFHVQRLYKLIEDRTIDKYDLVIIKNGTSKATDLLGSKDLNKLILNGASTKIPPIASQIASYLIGNGKVVRRVYWDDYDTAKDAVKKCLLVPALHHHVISATNNVDKSINMSLSAQVALTPMEELCYMMSPAFSMTRLNFIAKGASFRCEEEFISDCMEMPKLKMYIYRVKNQFKKQMAALEQLGAEVVRDVIERINADDIAGVASQLGTKAESPQDVVKYIMRNKMEDYARDKRAKHHIQNVIVKALVGYKRGQVELKDIDDLEERLIQCGFIRDEKIDVWKLDEKDRKELPSNGYFRLTYTDADIHAQRPVLYKHPGIGEFCKERIAHYDQQLNEKGKVLDRVVDKLKDGNCPICREEMEKVAIAQCCGATYCASCAFTKSGFFGRQGTIQGTCNNCRKLISIKDYMFVGKDVDLGAIDKVEAVQESKKNSEQDISEEKKEDDIDWFNSKKVDVFRELMKNGQDRLLKSIGKEVPIQVKNLVIGTKEPEPVANDKRKFIIFANFENTLDTYEKVLKEEKIKFVRMQGSVSQMSRLYEEFVNDPNVRAMTINSSTKSSGLNLQMVTDIVFVHKIQNSDIEEQAVGRMFRLGKRNEARVHYILYENEKRL